MLRNKRYRIIKLLIQIGDAILDSKLGKKLESNYRKSNKEVSMKNDDLVYWYKMDKRPPPKSGKYLVAFSSRNFNYDVDEYDANTGQWDFYNKEDMVKVKWWMEIPSIFDGESNE